MNTRSEKDIVDGVEYEITVKYSRKLQSIKNKTIPFYGSLNIIISRLLYN